jgi:hypothetical protein
VNNAAIGSNIPPVAIEEIDTALWDEFMAVNVRGTFLCVKAAIPAMRRNNYGKIINLSSTTMLSGLSHRLHYVTTKGAIAAMTRSMARELGAYGIRVNSLAPGLVMNDSVAAAMAGRPGLHEFVLNTRAIKKDVFADELVGTLIYLASPDSDAVTGQFLIVDNGGDYTYGKSAFTASQRPANNVSVAADAVRRGAVQCTPFARASIFSWMPSIASIATTAGRSQAISPCRSSWRCFRFSSS